MAKKKPAKANVDISIVARLFSVAQKSEATMCGATKNVLALVNNMPKEQAHVFLDFVARHANKDRDLFSEVEKIWEKLFPNEKMPEIDPARPEVKRAADSQKMEFNAG